ncbi:MAG: TauD/TfdA family dioxygenase, partial [Pseudomonadota bacterium]|nr:TauD/TfdA family dioxygenase [Pseudomonadota bacterium]
MDGAGPGATYQVITVKPYSPAIGAEIGNIDLTRPLTDLELSEIRRAFTDYMVLFFRQQEISFDDHARFGEYFGTLGQHVGKKTNSQATNDLRVRKFHADGETPRVSGNVWHTDQSCAPIPPLASVLYLHTLPPNGGGDTGFASMYGAYDALSDNMKTYLEGLTAHHDGSRQFGAGTPEADHPVVVRHPESGRKLLYVNEAFTSHINEVSREESKAILEFLYDHQKRP